LFQCVRVADATRGSTTVHRWGSAALLRRNDTAGSLVDRGAGDDLPEDALEWSWPPYAPVGTDDEPFDTAEWAPSSVVWHPHLRVGRWTVVYRR
jgi:hypothetical protein